MSANPILAELVRGNWVENRHRGAYVVVNAAGKILVSAGDISRAIFPRSAIKSMQALALYRSGAIEKFNFDSQDIAIACASHHGEAAHIEAVTRVMRKIGVHEEDFECGAHPPSNPAARKALKDAGKIPSVLHNNCSGKHVGMLAVAKALNVPTGDYSKRDHPVQKLVRACIEDVLAIPLTTDRCGIDGCSIPTWAAPLEKFALSFARMATGRGLGEDAIAAKSIIDAATAHPFLIAGTGVFDTDAMQVFGGKLMLKVGAEGVYCGALPDLGLGFALKCDDGNMNAAEVAIAQLLADIAQPEEAQLEFLGQRQIIKQQNWRKLEVAEMRACTV